MLIIAVIIAIISTVLTVYDWNQGQVVLGKEYSFEDDYNLYTEYADDYVKTWDKNFLKDENVTINSEINDGCVKVIVEGEFSKVEARYPIKVELREEKSEIIISYSDGTYEKLTNLPSKFDVYFIIALYFCITTIEFYLIISVIIWILDTTIKFIKEKIYQNMKQKEENNNK